MNKVKIKIQQFGNTLSSMIMPNIGVFIAWGLITSFFIPTGWYPHERLAELVSPILEYLLPILIGYSGGKLAYKGVRGGVIGAIATMGVVVGADIPMLLGAMIFGPLSGYLMKKIDNLLEGNIKEGFEMLVNNFSIGILGAILAIIGTLSVGPIISKLTAVLASGVDWLVAHKMLPLTSLFIEPAKVLFLNNGINHGILTPLGTEQATTAGKSILFLLEANPGPGLGILLAYAFFGTGVAKKTSPAAIIIHFFGGIHEIYFPFILMNPILIIAAIVGGASGIFTLLTLNGGLKVPASPGSFLAIMASTPSSGGAYFSNIIGILVATAVSFLIAMFFLKLKGTNGEADITSATEASQKMKYAHNRPQPSNKQNTLPRNSQHIIFACDAGMGSSAMGASLLRKKIKKASLAIKVSNTAVSQLDEKAQIVITQNELTKQARIRAPHAYHISVDNFLDSPKYDNLIADLKKVNTSLVDIEAETSTNRHFALDHDHIFLNRNFATKEEAIKFTGEKLVALKHVTPKYTKEMLKRDQIASVAIGNGVAIPHGTEASRSEIISSGTIFIQVPNGVDFDGQIVYVMFGIAHSATDQVETLAKIADICSEQTNVNLLANLKTKDEIINMFK